MAVTRACARLAAPSLVQIRAVSYVAVDSARSSSTAGSTRSAGQRGGPTEDSRPERMAVTRACARLAAPSLV